MENGHSHPRAVLLMYLWSLLVSGSALAVGLIDGRTTVGLVPAGAAFLFLITALRPLGWRRHDEGPRGPLGGRSSPAQ